MRFPRYIPALILLTPLLLSVSLPSARSGSPKQVILSETLWGGSVFDYSNCVRVDASGNVYSVGVTTSFGIGGADVFFLKYNSTGGLLWQKTWGEPNADEIDNGCAVDSQGNIYAAGWVQPLGGACYAWSSYGPCQVFLVKVNSSGNLVWQKLWAGNGSNVVRGITVDASGNVFVSGYFAAIIGSGINQTLEDNSFLLKFNSTGSLQWQRGWGGSQSDHAATIVADAAGYVYMTGYTKSFGDHSGDLFLLKVSPSGSIIWDRAWGTTGFDEGLGITTDGSANVYVTGRTGGFKNPGTGGADVVLLKYNATGNLEWERVWGATGQDGTDSVGVSVTVDNSANVHITGRTGSSGYNPSSWGLLYLEFDSSGNLLVQKMFGSLNHYDQGNSVASGPSDSVYIAGFVSADPPYFHVPLHFSVFNSILGSSTPTIPIRSLTNPVVLLNGTMTSPIGSNSYAGQADALLLKFGSGKPSAKVPTPPESLTVKPDPTGSSLSWGWPTTDGGSAITTFDIYRGTTKGGETFLTSVPETGRTITYTDTNMTTSSQYVYYVAAENAVGQSQPSNESGASSTVFNPLAPTLLMVLAIIILIPRAYRLRRVRLHSVMLT